MTTRPLFADDRTAARLLSMQESELREAAPHLPEKVEIAPGVKRWRVADLAKIGQAHENPLDEVQWK